MLISVVIPVYNVEEYIGDTIYSLIQQEYSDFEIIFVNDGSTDNSSSIIYAKLKNKKIKYTIIDQKNSGQGVARNNGVKVANGQWIYFLDADDIIQPFTFSLFAETINKISNCDIVFSEYQYVNKDNLFDYTKKNSATEIYTREEILKGFLLRTVIPLVPGTFYKKTFLQKNNIRHPNLRWSEDQYFMWNVLNNLTKAVKNNCITYNYYRHTGYSVMNSTNIDTIYESYLEFIKLNQKINEKLVKDFLLSRWVLGCCHILAKRNNYYTFKTISNRLMLKRHLFKLMKFPIFKIRVTSLIGIINIRLLYYLLNC